MADTSTNLPENEPTMNVTVVAPESIWRAMKNRATEKRGQSASDVWVEAAREYLVRRCQAEDAA